MGWAYGLNSRGDEIGYALSAICGQYGCGERIDKGLAFCCGDLCGVSGNCGCGFYFCAKHLFYSDQRCATHDGNHQLCTACTTDVERIHDVYDDNNHNDETQGQKEAQANDNDYAAGYDHHNDDPSHDDHELTYNNNALREGTR